MAADLIYESMPRLCLIIPRAARYLPKRALNNIPSLCVYCYLYGSDAVYSIVQVVCIETVNIVQFGIG